MIKFWFDKKLYRVRGSRERATGSSMTNEIVLHLSDPRRSTHLDQVEWVAYSLSPASRRSVRKTSLRVVRLRRREWPMIVQIRMYSSLPLHTCHRFLKKIAEVPFIASYWSHQQRHNSNWVNAARHNWIRKVCVCSLARRKALGRRLICTCLWKGQRLNHQRVLVLIFLIT
jgi:hypothetical protein